LLQPKPQKPRSQPRNPSASSEHHLVLVVRTHEGDLVADNLNSNIRNWKLIGPHRVVQVEC
jgi:predicted transglutaminase-like cysteine proteinase